MTQKTEGIEDVYMNKDTLENEYICTRKYRNQIGEGPMKETSDV